MQLNVDQSEIREPDHRSGDGRTSHTSRRYRELALPLFSVTMYW